MQFRSPVQIGGMDLAVAVIHAGIHLFSSVAPYGDPTPQDGPQP
jgi:hypothetical protein